jgi:hypothetical protein
LEAPAGDIAGLGRAFRLSGRLDDALGCLDIALAARSTPYAPTQVHPAAVRDAGDVETEWWRGPVDIPWGLARRPAVEPTRVGDAWTEQRLLVERAHLLRRLERPAEAVDSWIAAAAGPGRLAALAWVEVAKLRERRLGDLAGALAATERARSAAERRRWLGLPEPRLEEAIAARLARLRARLARRSGATVASIAAGSG